MVVDDDIDLGLGRNIVVRAGRRAVDQGKVGALLECFGSQVLHLDIEQVDKRPVLLVADIALIEDPGGEGFWVCVLCDLGKRHGRGDRIGIRVLVGDDPECAFPACKQGEEPLGDPARVLLLDLEDRGPGNHFLRVEDKIRAGSGKFLAVHRIDDPGDDLHEGIPFLDREDCREVCIAAHRS